MSNQVYLDTWNNDFKPVTVDEVLKYVGPGWHPLVRDLIDELFSHGWDGKLGQIKEKFGELRFYLGGESSPEIYKAISRAEAKSIRICERCGQPGKRRSGGWIKTLCEEHASN